MNNKDLTPCRVLLFMQYMRVIHFHHSVPPGLFDQCRQSIPGVQRLSSQDLCDDVSVLVASLSVLPEDDIQIGLVRGKGCRIIFTGEPSPAQAEILLSHGDAFCIPLPKLASALQGLASETGLETGEIIVLGADDAAVEMFCSISDLFGYRARPAVCIEELSALIGPATVLAVHDLASPGSDIFQFVKKALHSPLKSLPYVAYKSSGSRIDLADIQSGIRSLTRFILSREEAFAQVALLLFKKSYHPALMRLASSAGADLPVFGSESMKKIFFAQPKQFYPEHFPSALSVFDAADDMHRTSLAALARLDAVRWIFDLCRTGKDIT